MAKSFNMSKFKSQMNKIQRDAKKIERQFKQGINDYNRAVRQYNSNVRTAQNKIQIELNRMQTATYTVKTNYYISTKVVHDTYTKVSNSYDNGDIDESIFEAIENEDANNLELGNVVLNNEEIENYDVELDESNISAKLIKISSDLDNRWKGALFSLNPNNPEAARHFCTSTREILKVLIDDGIKDKDVVATNPQCEKTNNGTPTRKEKIKYAMNKKGISNKLIIEFTNNNIENAVSLINELSNGTHGHSNRYSLNQLKSFKKRFEASINFICDYVI